LVTQARLSNQPHIKKILKEYQSALSNYTILIDETKLELTGINAALVQLNAKYNQYYTAINDNVT
jgi:chromosome segregation ATPase